MLEERALEVWHAVDRVDYQWPVGAKVLDRLSVVLAQPIVGEPTEAPEALNRRLRVLVGSALKSEASAADLYEWIVCGWGGVRGSAKARETVRAWAATENAWHADYDDAVLMAFAQANRTRRISSWSKIFAYADPDRFAIYDSRVAVALNIALHRIGEGARFYMPESKVYRPKGQAPRPNAVARARTSFGPAHQLGYGDFLRWAKAVCVQQSARAEGPLDLLEIEMRLFAAAPQMAGAYLASLD